MVGQRIINDARPCKQCNHLIVYQILNCMMKAKTLVSILARASVVGTSLSPSNLIGSGFGIGLGSKGFSNPFAFSFSNTTHEHVTHEIPS